MTKVNEANLYSVGPTPQEIITLREEIIDFHRQYGQPIIYKHRWNLRDLENGLCQRCPNEDHTYRRDKTDCPYCFGTGFLGGFDDGVIIFVTMADAPVDQLKITPEGIIMFDRHPQLTAPWNPPMGDGDLLIEADFDFSTWNVLQTFDRHELNEVIPVTIRGEYHNYGKFLVQNNSKLDRIPDNHVYYNVPIVFDYASAPAQVFPPIGVDPDDYTLPYTELIQGIRMIGLEPGPSTSFNIPLKIFGRGTNSARTQGLHITGDQEGTTVILP